MVTRHEALALLHEYTKSDSLRNHGLAVEAAMRWYARHLGKSDSEIDAWGIAGLVHDFDYEKYPDVGPEGHPFKGSKILADLGWPEDIRTAILGHGSMTGVPRTTNMAKCLFAVDELCGFLIACALVRPDKSLNGLEVKSVRKKMKDKAFARACSREDIIQGAGELEIDLDQHIDNTIKALREVAGVLGLA